MTIHRYDTLTINGQTFVADSVSIVQFFAFLGRAFAGGFGVTSARHDERAATTPW
jgi:hypothetical protein